MEKAIAVLDGTSRSVETERGTDTPPTRAAEVDRKRILESAAQMRILDPNLFRDLIRRRQALGIDQHDEVWEGVYLVPPLASNDHQHAATFLATILFNIISLEGMGRVHAGANVSDRQQDWEHNFRAPDVVVVLNGGRAIDCGTHWMGGPDFLIEIASPGDETEEKIPFYTQLQVRELLIVGRDTRELRLYRHDGQQLALVPPSAFRRKPWLVSQVVPLAFRQVDSDQGPRMEVRRTDGKRGSWSV
jgi:Uma2 family endonuclease